MGVGTRESSVYLSVSDGKVVQAFKEQRPGTVARVNKKGNTVYENRYDYLEGRITGLETRTHDFGKDYVLSVVDGEDTYKLNIQFSSRYATSFLKCVPNLDLSQPVKIVPFKMPDRNDKTKSVTGIVLYQSGKKVDPFYTKEAPNGLPQMTQVKLKGQLVWDSTDMDEFLEKMALETINGKATQRPFPGDSLPQADAAADDVETLI